MQTTYNVVLNNKHYTVAINKAEFQATANIIMLCFVHILDMTVIEAKRLYRQSIKQVRDNAMLISNKQVSISIADARYSDNVDFMFTAAQADAIRDA